MSTKRMTLPKTLTLRRGSHTDREKGVCVMEAVAWLAGEPHSDTPACACPIICKASNIMNDCAPSDEIRTSVLKPYLTRLVGSKATPEIEKRRMFAIADLAVRTFAADAMESARLPEEAKKLRALGVIVDEPTAKAAALAAEGAAEAAGYASMAAALAAVAAGHAALAAVLAVSGAATWAAGAASWAVWDAGDAAKAEAWTRYTKMILDTLLEI